MSEIATPVMVFAIMVGAALVVLLVSAFWRH